MMIALAASFSFLPPSRFLFELVGESLLAAAISLDPAGRL